jgi:hypothetical protein
VTLELGQISLRCLPGKGADRALCIGGSGSGKSTLGDRLGLDWDQRYARRKGRRLILDRKPRYKAERLANGLPAKRLYKDWDHGSPVPGSVLVDDPEDLRLAWETGSRVAICQGDSDADIPRMLAVATRYLKDARASRPQLLQVDEMLYFFGPTGMPKGGSDVLKTYAVGGRERGIASLFCSQRTKGFPASILEECNRLYLFRLDYREDVKRLREMGAPVEDEDIPDEEYLFRYWYKADYHNLYGPYRLTLGA